MSMCTAILGFAVTVAPAVAMWPQHIGVSSSLWLVPGRLPVWLLLGQASPSARMILHGTYQLLT